MAGGVLLLATLFPVVGVAPAACAAEGGSAVLVVDTGDAEQRLCVALPEDEVTGLELIVLANEQHGLTYKFGFGGEAVCMLADVGPTGDDCFEDYPDFWGYWRGDGSGGWSWSSSGAGSTTVTDGDVEGWSWGSGNDGSSHPQPPATTFASVCGEVAEDDPEPGEPRDPNRKNRQRQGRAPAPQEPADDGGAGEGSGDRIRRTKERTRRAPSKQVRRNEDKEERTKKEKEKERNALASAEPSDADPPAEDDEGVRAVGEPASGRPGPPPAGLAELGAAAAVGGAGFFLARRRRSRA